MARFVRQPGKSRQYLDRVTGEIISRRQRDKIQDAAHERTKRAPEAAAKARADTQSWWQSLKTFFRKITGQKSKGKVKEAAPAPTRKPKNLREAARSPEWQFEQYFKKGKGKPKPFAEIYKDDPAALRAAVEAYEKAKRAARGRPFSRPTAGGHRVGRR